MISLLIFSISKTSSGVALGVPGLIFNSLSVISVLILTSNNFSVNSSASSVYLVTIKSLFKASSGIFPLLSSTKRFPISSHLVANSSLIFMYSSALSSVSTPILAHSNAIFSKTDILRRLPGPYLRRTSFLKNWVICKMTSGGS